jgi:hypothetical protein
MWLYPGRLALLKQRTYERPPNLGGPNKDGEKALWVIRETAYVGRGVFAAKAFEAGDIIIAERPLELHTYASGHYSCLGSR